MNKTTNFLLNKPEQTDTVNIDDLNANFDILDVEVKKAIDNIYTHPAQTARTSGLYKITVDATGHVTAVTAVAKTDITALGIPAQDTVYTHPAQTARTSGIYKITVDATGHVTAVVAVTKADITALGIPAQDTVYMHPSSHPASMITGLPTSLPANGGNADTVDSRHIAVLTQAQYDALGTKDANTIYFTT